MARLKVFEWSDGFHAYTVAATSRRKALAAWGFKRDLFKEGAAHEITEGDDADAALARPGEVIERGLAVDVGAVTRVKPVKTGKPSAARARLDALKAELDALETKQEAERAALDARRAALDKEIEGLGQAHKAARDGLKARIDKARDKA